MKTLITKNTWNTFSKCGWGNGYVAIPKGNKFYGMPYNNIPVNVHGGLTFSELVDEDFMTQWELTDDYLGMWVVGFDTCHYGDNKEKWTKEKVQEETDDLLNQLIELSK